MKKTETLDLKFRVLKRRKAKFDREIEKAFFEGLPIFLAGALIILFYSII